MHKYNAYRKAAGVLAKHPTKIQSGKEAKALVSCEQEFVHKIYAVHQELGPFVQN